MTLLAGGDTHRVPRPPSSQIPRGRVLLAQTVACSKRLPPRLVCGRSSFATPQHIDAWRAAVLKNRRRHPPPVCVYTSECVCVCVFLSLPLCDCFVQRYPPSKVCACAVFTTKKTCRQTTSGAYRTISSTICL